MSQAQVFNSLTAFFTRILAEVRPHLNLESVQSFTAAAATKTMEYAQNHPCSTAFTALNVGLAPVLGAGWLTAPLLKVVGFGPLGPLGGSLAAWYQSSYLGAYIPAGSIFSGLQKWAMTVA